MYCHLLNTLKSYFVDFSNIEILDLYEKLKDSIEFMLTVLTKKLCKLTISNIENGIYTINDIELVEKIEEENAILNIVLKVFKIHN